MKSNAVSKAVTCAITALTMGFSGIALAQQDKDVRADQAGRGQDRSVRIPQHPDRDTGRRGDYRGDDRRGQQQRDERARFEDRRWNAPDHGWVRGNRLPPEYRNRQYVVDDWRGHHLRQPPRGYQWVQSGGDYILAAIATGVIVDILLNH